MVLQEKLMIGLFFIEKYLQIEEKQLNEKRKLKIKRVENILNIYLLKNN